MTKMIICAHVAEKCYKGQEGWVSKVPTSLIKDLYNKWNYTNCDLEERVAGLLVMYYGLSNDELRHLKNDDLTNGFMHVRNQVMELDSRLNSLVNEFLIYKENRFFGVKTTYFFVTAYSIPKDVPVSLGHFSKLFKGRNVGLSPSELRKAMYIFTRIIAKVILFTLLVCLELVLVVQQDILIK